MQLGPDTVGPHPDHPEIICFNVTNAGGRSIKAFARKRYVPVRAELWTNGLMEIVENARRQGWKTLWPATEVNPDLTSLSNMFSGFWSDFLRKQVGVGDPKKTLYSLRHNFRDAMATAGGADFERDQLMGHSEQGTGRKYGAKRTPRAVDIVRLNDLVQKVSWLFLQSVRWPQK
jgi:integrase